MRCMQQENTLFNALDVHVQMWKSCVLWTQKWKSTRLWLWLEKSWKRHSEK